MRIEDVGKSYFEVYTNGKRVDTIEEHGLLFVNKGDHGELVTASICNSDILRAACCLVFYLQGEGLLDELSKMLRIEMIGKLMQEVIGDEK